MLKGKAHADTVPGIAKLPARPAQICSAEFPADHRQPRGVPFDEDQQPGVVLVELIGAPPRPCRLPIRASIL